MRLSVIAYERRLSGARCTQEAPRRKTRSILAPSTRRPEMSHASDGVEPGHNSRPRVRSKSVHAVEFSKTVAPLRKGSPSEGARSDPADTEADR